MNQKIGSYPSHVEMDLPAAEYLKEKDCDKCNKRFKCWTHRGVTLTVEHFSLTADAMTRDRMMLVAKVPPCFRCSNLVGTEVHVHIKIAEQEQHFKAFIMKQELRAEGETPMELELEAVDRRPI